MIHFLISRIIQKFPELAHKSNLNTLEKQEASPPVEGRRQHGKASKILWMLLQDLQGEELKKVR